VELTQIINIAFSKRTAEELYQDGGM